MWEKGPLCRGIRAVVVCGACMLFSCNGFSMIEVLDTRPPRYVSTFAGAAGLPGSADGTGSAARFYQPSGVTSDGSSLYVTDSGNNTIRQIVISTGVVTTLAGTPSVTGGSADGTGSAAQFNASRLIAFDGTDLYLADAGNHTIRKIVISTGVVTTPFGTAGASGSVDGTGNAARFNGPRGIGTDGTCLYVADTGNYTIRQIVISTGAVTTLAGTPGASGSADGIGAAARFNDVRGIATDGANLYVVDAGKNTIRKIVISTAVVTTLAGTAGVTGAADGTGSAAQFNGPRGITISGANLYVTDYGNNTIRKIVIATGAVTTLSGTAGATGGTDGVGGAAQFNQPYGITTVGTDFYVTEQGNNTIRLVR